MSKRRKPRRTRLSNKTVDALGPEDQRYLVWDTDITGLALRVAPTGRKTFVLSYRVATKQHLMTLGRYGILTVSQARKRAVEELGRVARGEDPVERRREDRRAKLTFGEYARDWLAKGGRRGNPNTASVDRQWLEGRVLPVIGREALSELSRGDMDALHATLASSGMVSANRTLELVRKLLNDAKRDGLLEGENPAAGSWRSRRGRGAHERSRTEYLRRDQFDAFAEAVEAEPSPFVRSAFWLLLLTGARNVSELLRLRWSDIDFDAGLVTFDRPKTADVHTLPLSKPASEILSELPREAGNPFVFPSPRPGSARHLASLRAPWDRIRKRAGLEHLTVHDLRRSAGSFMAQAGVPLQHIAAVLGHSDEKVTRIYARLSGDEVRAAVDTLGERVEALRRGNDGQATDQLRREAEELRQRLAAVEARLEEST